MAILRQPTHLPLEHYDPRAKPHWRWDAAERIDHKTASLKRYPDAAVKAAVAHLRAKAPSKKGYDPAIARAYTIFNNGTLLKAEIQARFIAGQTPEQMARACCLPVDALRHYQTLFFAVPRGAFDYIRGHIIGAGPSRGFHKDELPRFWAWIALNGSAILEPFLKAFKTAHQSEEPASLSVYLREGAVHPQLQLFVAGAVLPTSAGWDDWHVQLGAQYLKVDILDDPVERSLALAQLQQMVVHAGRSASAGGSPPAWRKETQVKANQQHQQPEETLAERSSFTPLSAMLSKYSPVPVGEGITSH